MTGANPMLILREGERVWRASLLALGLMMMALAWANDSRASCVASIADVSQGEVVSFDPFSGEAGAASVRVKIHKDEGSTCLLGLATAGLTPGSERRLRGLGSDLTYVVMTTAGAELSNDFGATLAVSVAEGGDTTIDLRLKVPTGQMASAGRFEDSLILRLYDLDAGPSQLGQDVTAPVAAVVDARAQVNIAGSSGPFQDGGFSLPRIDFGTVSGPVSRAAYVQVRATSSVSISVSSANGGRMCLVERATPCSPLSYALSLDGEELALTQGPRTIHGDPPLSLAGISYPMVVRLTGDYGSFSAGDYEDLITVEVTPN